MQTDKTHLRRTQALAVLAAGLRVEIALAVEQARAVARRTAPLRLSSPATYKYMKKTNGGGENGKPARPPKIVIQKGASHAD